MSYQTAIHAPDCARLITGVLNPQPLYECGGTYTCNRCDREFGWCSGAMDDTPALCDACANLVQGDP